MFALSRLSAERQRNVGSALEAHFKTKPKYTAEVTRGALAVIEATSALGRSDDLPMFTIDGATDSVVSAIYRVAQAIQKGLVATVVPLSAEQQAQLDAAVLIETTWFPHGIGFIRDAVGIQYAAMGAIRRSLSDPESGPALKEAVKTLGLGPLVEHFMTHAALYAKKLGLAGEVVTEAKGEPRDPSDVWHEAFVSFAIDVMSAYRNDPAKQKTLLGSYESQLAEYRAELAKNRKRAEKKAKAEAAKGEATEAEAAKGEAVKKSDS
jgi:hypothetical protein